MPKAKKENPEPNNELVKYGVPRIFEEKPDGVRTRYYIGIEDMKDGLRTLRVMSGFLFSRKEAEDFIRFLQARKSRLGYYMSEDAG